MSAKVNKMIRKPLDFRGLFYYDVRNVILVYLSRFIYNKDCDTIKETNDLIKIQLRVSVTNIKTLIK